ncbi:unnamed protein product [Allacma fusca]|uniref:Uncharacterized protein n=1 Tax=Allacma fusca TaxID=39272 RepID=A0A8J2NX50_9HEXA|nr:unnamed protein product [Allacma fusca]
MKLILAFCLVVGFVIDEAYQCPPVGYSGSTKNPAVYYYCQLTRPPNTYMIPSTSTSSSTSTTPSSPSTSTTTTTSSTPSTTPTTTSITASTTSTTTSTTPSTTTATTTQDPNIPGNLGG